ncbi:MAG: hypothetical protein ACYS8I_16060 [Planctomycetota bacterium]|jgi:hypothetical protein
MKCPTCGKYANYSDCGEAWADTDELDRDQLLVTATVPVFCSACDCEIGEWITTKYLDEFHCDCDVDDEEYEEFEGEMYYVDLNCNFEKLDKHYALSIYGDGHCYGCGGSFTVQLRITASEMEIVS